MAWLRRLFGGSSAKPEAPVPVAPAPAPAQSSVPPSPLAPVMLKGRASVEVKGEASYQPALEALAGGKQSDGARLDVTAYLRCEPSNRYDENAVKVEVQERLVGYLRRDLAASYCPLLSRMERQGQQATCAATIVGGWKRDDGDEGSFGIWLKMPSPDLLARQMSQGG